MANFLMAALSFAYESSQPSLVEMKGAPRFGRAMEAQRKQSPTKSKAAVLDVFRVMGMQFPEPSESFLAVTSVQVIPVTSASLCKCASVEDTYRGSLPSVSGVSVKTTCCAWKKCFPFVRVYSLTLAKLQNPICMAMHIAILSMEFELKRVFFA